MKCRYNLTIIIPFYNAEKFLNRIVTQIQESQDERLEVIFVDDGSKDNGLKKIEQLTRNMMNVHILLQTNQGAPTARNAGIRKAKGKYIWFFDVDDLFEKSAIKYMLDLIDRSEEDIYIGNMLLEDEKHIKSRVLPIFRDSESTEKKKLFLLESFPGNKIYKKEIIDKYNIKWDDVKIHQDLNFYLKYIVFCEKINYSEKNLYLHQIHKNSISTSTDKRIMDVVKSIEYAKRYYKRYHMDKMYAQELEFVLVKYLLYQVTRIKNVKGIRNKFQVYLYFRKVLSNVNNENKYLNDIYKQKIMKLRTFRI